MTMQVAAHDPVTRSAGLNTIIPDRLNIGGLMRMRRGGQLGRFHKRLHRDLARRRCKSGRRKSGRRMSDRRRENILVNDPGVPKITIVAGPCRPHGPIRTARECDALIVGAIRIGQHLRAMPARAIELEHDVLPDTCRAPHFDHAIRFGELQRRDGQAAVGIDRDLRILHEARNVQRETPSPCPPSVPPNARHPAAPTGSVREMYSGLPLVFSR